MKTSKAYKSDLHNLDNKLSSLMKTALFSAGNATLSYQIKVSVIKVLKRLLS